MDSQRKIKRSEDARSIHNQSLWAQETSIRNDI